MNPSNKSRRKKSLIGYVWRKDKFEYGTPIILFKHYDKEAESIIKKVCITFEEI